MAEIIKHAEPEDTYDDADHPIPSLTHLDICGIRKGGGADLVIIIAEPLQSDEYSLNRLLDKIEAYLGHIRSKEFADEAGEPDPSNTTIDVNIHPDSCREAFRLLEKSKEWVQVNGASLRVTLLDDV